MAIFISTPFTGTHFESFCSTNVAIIFLVCCSVQFYPGFGDAGPGWACWSSSPWRSASVAHWRSDRSSTNLATDEQQQQTPHHTSPTHEPGSSTSADDRTSMTTTDPNNAATSAGAAPHLSPPQIHRTRGQGNPLGILTLISMAWLVAFGLRFSPADREPA